MAKAKLKIIKGRRYDTKDGRRLKVIEEHPSTPPAPLPEDATKEEKKRHASETAEALANEIIVVDLEGEGSSWPMTRGNLEALIKIAKAK